MPLDPSIEEEILVKAADVFGNRAAAEAWMSRNAVGLDRRRPIDWLQTEEGAQIVRDFLVRLEYSVYS